MNFIESGIIWAKGAFMKFMSYIRDLYSFINLFLNSVTAGVYIAKRFKEKNLSCYLIYSELQFPGTRLTRRINTREP